MSNLFEDTPTKELPWLLKQIQQREIALPDFQRDFVWEPYSTQELIVSIASNYPAGSLLAIRNSQNYFSAREFSGAPQLGGFTPTYLILDGQQRLTSLYQAFYGVGEYQYFIRLKPLLDGSEIDDDGVVFYLKSAAQRGWQAKSLRRYQTIEGQAEDLVLPLSVLGGQRSGFYQWMDEVCERIEERDQRRALKEKLISIKDGVIQNFDSYKFPVVVLSDRTPPDAVCTIFETLNRTGVKLSVFDLLTARFFAQNVKLRDMWHSAIRDFPILRDYEIDPYYLLQIIAMLRTEGAPSCKRKEVLALKAEKVESDWERAVEGMVQALTILRDDCGVLNPKWLPYTTILIPFGALLARHPGQNGLEKGMIRKRLINWYWCSIFGQTYENSPNSQSAKDYQEVGQWLIGGMAPASMRGFSFDSEVLRDVTPRQRALYRGVITLVLSKNPRDFHEVKPMTRALMEENHVDDHHVFPDAYLKDLGEREQSRRECILNRTLIDRSTNQSLSRRDPQSYFAEIKDRLGIAELERLLESHMLPAGADSPLQNNDYPAFLKWRQERIGAAIKEATQNV